MKEGNSGEWWMGWIHLWYIAITFIISCCTPSTITIKSSKIHSQNAMDRGFLVSKWKK
jgi:hypothetical protein